MNISNLINKILTSVLYFTTLQANNEVNAQNATMGERSWDFPPHSSYTLKQISSLPYNVYLEPGSVLGYETGCNAFRNKSTNETIIPKFIFQYSQDTMPIKISDSIPDIQPGQITTECSKLSFRHTHNVEVIITNDSDVHVVGVDCDSGL